MISLLLKKGYYFQIKNMVTNKNKVMKRIYGTTENRVSLKNSLNKLRCEL